MANPGLRLFAIGSNWSPCFQRATELLSGNENAMLVLGPSLSPFGEEWITKRVLKISNPIFGRRVWRWHEFVEHLARTEAVADGKGFRILGPMAERALLRRLLESFEESGALVTLSGIWREERLFAHLLETLQELRLSGLVNHPSIETFRLRLAEQPVDHQDLWALLLAWQAALDSEENLYDFSALLQEVTGDSSPEHLVILGLDEPSTLEKELLHRIAKRSVVEWYISVPESLASEKLEGVGLGFAGPLSSEQWKDQPFELSPRIFQLATPQEEARAVARLVAESLSEKKSVQLVHPSLGDSHWWTEFWRSLGVEQPPSRIGQSAVARRVFSLLAPVPFSYARGVDFLRHHQDFYNDDERKEISRLVEVAKAKGCESLDQWKALWVEHSLPELEEKFWVWAKLWPETLDHGTFLSFLDQCGFCLQWGSWSQKAPLPTVERELHLVLSQILRQGRSLAAHGTGLSKPQHWFQEWKTITFRQGLFWENHLPEGLSLFPFDSWLPPLLENERRILAGLQTPLSEKFRLFLAENIRGKLTDFSLKSHRERESHRILWLKGALQEDASLCFSSLMGAEGKEKELPWMLGALNCVAESLSPVPVGSVAPWKFPEQRFTLPSSLSRQTISVSFLDQFVKCPFQALARTLIRDGDFSIDLGMDIEATDLGRCLHRTLELFVKISPLRDLQSSQEAIQRMQTCFHEAWVAMVPKGISHVPFVQEAQKRDWGERLERVAVKLYEDWQKTPSLNRSDTEVPFEMEDKESGLTIKGRIDRIDFDDTNKLFWVRDYKSGGTKIDSDDVLSNFQELQLPLYLKALKAKLPEYSAAGASYFMIKDAKEGPFLARSRFNGAPKKRDKDDPAYYFSRVRHLLSDEEFSLLQDQQEQFLKGLLQRVAQGEYSVSPFDPEKTCVNCEVRPACRIGEQDFSVPQQWVNPEWNWERLKKRLTRASLVSNKGKSADKAQQEALDRKNSFVFVEASAGSGKTTLIVLRILKEIRDSLAQGLSLEEACDRWRAISFTDKAAHELKGRLAAAMLGDYGEAGAALGAKQVSTIHGFCAELIGKFPAQSSLHPASTVMDERRSRLEFRKCLMGLFRKEEFFPKWSSLGLNRKEVERLIDSFRAKSVTASSIWSTYTAFLRGASDQSFSFVLPVEREEQSRLRNFLDLAEIVEREWRQWKLDRAVLDFDDLEKGASAVLQDENACRAFTLPLILVDEFQDTNLPQRELLSRIAKKDWSNFFVVGDAKQSIYRFRAADVSVFQSLKKQAAARGELVELSSNYRSKREIVDAVNLLMAEMFPSEEEDAPLFEAQATVAIPARGEGGVFQLWEYEVDRNVVRERVHAEAAIVVKLVKQQLSSGKKPGDIVLILRKIKGNEGYLKALSEAGIPYLLGSSSGFFSQTIVSDGIALLRSLYGIENEISNLAVVRSPWMRVGADRWSTEGSKGILARDPWYLRMQQLSGTSSMAKLLSIAFEDYPMDRNGALQGEKLVHFVEKMEEEGSSPSEVVEQLSQWAGWEGQKDKEDDSAVVIPDRDHSIRVMTIHASKGLEFPVVILAGLEADARIGNAPFRVVGGVGLAISPLEDSEEDTAFQILGREEKAREQAEWKRLLYVACTRAQEECHIVLPKNPKEAKGRDSGNPAFWISSALGDKYKKSASGLESTQKSFSPLPKMEEPEPFLLKNFRAPPRRSLTVSVTELASFSFCPEFHRRKFVQGWDDTLVSLWDSGSKVPFKGSQKKTNGDMAQLNRTLAILGIERKERGVVLHRVMERIKDFSEPLARTWLKESYGELGMDNSLGPHMGEALEKLLDFDLSTLRRIYESESGRLLLNPRLPFVSELPFVWEGKGLRVIGSMDRLVHLREGLWAVVDYKSSLSEESIERYRYQVNLYRLAAQSKKEGLVTGYLMDLSTAHCETVSDDLGEFSQRLAGDFDQMLQSYTDPQVDWLSKEGMGGAHCFRCAYQVHCSVGQKLMVEFR